MKPPTSSTSPFVPETTAGNPDHSGISWPAIFAGLTAAMALQILFMMLGAGLGFAIYSPLTDDHPIAELGAGAMVIQGLSAVVSLWLGGWVAGRLAPAAMRANGWLHGFSVWTAATVAGVIVVSSGAGWALGDLSKLVGGGLSLAGKPAAAVVGSTVEVAKDAAKQTTETLTSFTDESLSRLPNGSGKDVSVRAKREIGFALAKMFNPAKPGNEAENRATLLKTIASQTGMSEAEANQMVTEWSAAYGRLKTELEEAKNAAETKARETAETAAKALSVFSLCSFVGFLLGAAAAAMGGKHGARHSIRAEIPSAMAASNPPSGYTFRGQPI